MNIEPLLPEDFDFSGPLGSSGASITALGADRFRVLLGSAPMHDNWPNMLQFKIRRHARGHAPVLEVGFEHPKMQFGFASYFQSWSYDHRAWRPLHWDVASRADDGLAVLAFPRFDRDVVYCGLQVPLDEQMSDRLHARWRRHPSVMVHALGVSQGGRPLRRLTIADPDTSPALSPRWCFHVSNQHPGEYNSQWRMVGMINWLLSSEGAAFRHRSVWHFILRMSPDGPENGWYRVNADGIDMNRSYRATGSDPRQQTHEACVFQRDLEALMQSDCPPTAIWSMHTWQGPVEMLLLPGPEFGNRIASWETLRERLLYHDREGLIDPLRLAGAKPSDVAGSYWSRGPHIQFGCTTVLCEGAGGIYRKRDNLAAGVVIMRALQDVYQ